MIASKQPAPVLDDRQRRRQVLINLKAGMERLISEWDAALSPVGMTSGQIVAGIVQALRNNPRLLDAGEDSIMRAVGRAVSLGVDISGATGEGWIVGPFDRYDKQLGRKSLSVELWLGVRGLIALMTRDASVRLVRPYVVYEGDEFSIDPLDPDRPLHHVPMGMSDRPVAWYCLIFLHTGAVHFGVVWRQQMPALQQAAEQRLGKGYAHSPWATHPEAMMQVQAIRIAGKWAPRSVANAQRAALLAHPAKGDLPEADSKTALEGFAEIDVLDVDTVPAIAQQETKPVQAVVPDLPKQDAVPVKAKEVK